MGMVTTDISAEAKGVRQRILIDLIGRVGIGICWSDRGTYLKVQVEFLKIVSGGKEKVLGKQKCS